MSKLARINAVRTSETEHKYFAKIVSVLYFLGALLHVADIFDLRLNFSEMNYIWKSWIVCLAVFDLIAAVGLWKNRSWGFYFFLIVATSQLLAYTVFKSFFGEQVPLVVFHCAVLFAYFILLIRKSPEDLNGADTNEKRKQ